MVEQPLFAAETAAIAGKCAVRSDDAMARHDNRDRVGAVRQPYGATRRGPAEPLSQLAITGRLARPDRAQGSPNLSLKLGPTSSHGDFIEVPDCTGEIGVEGIYDCHRRGGGTKLVAPILAPEQSHEARLAVNEF